MLLCLPGGRAACAQTATLTTLYAFSGPDGAGPISRLTTGTDGNFYGTTFQGGAHNTGTVFRLSPSGALTTLYTFSAVTWNGSLVAYVNAEGANPHGLIQGADGNFYGVACYGGPDGTGAVFKITPAGALTVLHAFSQTNLDTGINADGACPFGGLVKGADGSFYGTTHDGGGTGYGVVFKIAPGGAFTLLHAFSGLNNGTNADGANPQAPLLPGAAGSFYGTTYWGGAYGNGALFRITSRGAFTTLYAFSAFTSYNSLGYGANADGANPAAGLFKGKDGDLYGTTSQGGDEGCGAVFKITPSGALTTLWAFDGTDGANPGAGLIQSADGNFYGSATQGGFNGNGTLFRITPTGGETALYSFTAGNWSSDGTAYYNGDGIHPGDLVIGTDGNFYGAANSGGPNGAGALFRLNVVTISTLSPASADAGGPGFTLTVKGTAFLSSSTVFWNSTALATTYLSATQLTASVPASLLASAGTADVSIVSPGTAATGSSNTVPFTVLTTSLKLVSAKVSRNSTTGDYTATLTLKNIGYRTAAGIQLTSAALGAAATTAMLPAGLGSIPAGSSLNVPLSFPASAGSPGSVVALKVAGTFTGGSFSGSLKITLP